MSAEGGLRPAIKPTVSLRVARTLLFVAAGYAAAPPFMILVLSQEPTGALPYIALFFLTAGAFVVAGRDLAHRPQRARPLAVAAAFALAALGTITGFSLGMITFPGAAIGVLAAWATLLHPPRRAAVVAFVLYVAIGVLTAFAGGVSFAFIWSIPTLFIWPIWLLFVAGSSMLPIYGAFAVAATLAIGAFVQPRPFGQRIRARSAALAILVGILAGIVTVAAFVAWAYARPDTSARFELVPLVLALVFAGGLLAGSAAATLRLAPTRLTAVGLGLGAAILFLAFTYRPAVSCQENGMSQGLPLAWALTSFGSGSSSGSSGASIGGGSSPTSTGELRSGDRAATYRCEGARVVEYRELR